MWTSIDVVTTYYHYVVKIPIDNLHTTYHHTTLWRPFYYQFTTYTQPFYNHFYVPFWLPSYDHSTTYVQPIYYLLPTNIVTTFIQPLKYLSTTVILPICDLPPNYLLTTFIQPFYYLHTTIVLPFDNLSTTTVSQPFFCNIASYFFVISEDHSFKVALLSCTVFSQLKILENSFSVWAVCVWIDLFLGKPPWGIHVYLSATYLRLICVLGQKIYWVQK